MKRFGFWGLLPAQVLMILTMVIPLVIVIVVAFSTRGHYGGFEHVFSVEAFRGLLYAEGWGEGLEFTSRYLVIIGRSVGLAAMTTLICMLISFPVAYVISLQKGSTKTLLIYLVTLPFWTSMIVRIYAWLVILSKNGLLERGLGFLHIDAGSDGFLFSNGALLTGMVYSYVPLMILPVYAAVERLDPALIEASHDLHANRLRTLRKVILPLTWPGLLAGSILVFVPSLGATVEPILLGGGKQMMLGNLIMNQFGIDRNWPFGAALALVLLSMVMLVLLIRALAQPSPAGERQ